MRQKRSITEQVSLFHRQKILIVEDDDMQRTQLAERIRELPSALWVETAGSFSEAESLLRDSIINNEAYNLFLLDIHLSEDESKLEGFQYAQLIRSHTIYQLTPLIFLTSNSQQIEFALNNFHCYNYIRKPYSCKDIANRVEHILMSHCIQQDTFFIRDTKRIAHRLSKENILFMESNGHGIKIVCENASIVTRELSLSSVPELLGNNFLRCHKKFIINKNQILNFDGVCSSIQISGYTIPVGKSYKDALIENVKII